MGYHNDSGDVGRGTDYATASKTALDEMNKLFGLMGLTCEATYTGQEEDRLNYEITGPDANIFSQDGPTLDALQYLAYVLVGRLLGDRYSLSLDAEGYRERRRAELIEMATKIADEAVAAGQEAVLDPMRPHERRIVHMVLRERNDIETYSEGEEPFRCLVISPKT
jgi:spoIIIJ-associated protein